MAESDPGFIKCISDQSCLEKINISAANMNKDQGNLPNKIILKDQYGNDHWQVEVEKQQNELFLAKGWEKFVQENHLQVGDSVVFYHICPNVYEVVLLGHDSCDKEGVGGLKSEEEEVKGKDEVDEEKQKDSVHHLAWILEIDTKEGGRRNM